MRCRASSLRRLDQPHLLVEVAPVLAVVDDAVDPGPKLRIDRRAEFLLPPEIERQIGIELREDDVRQEAALFAANQKRELLGADLFASRVTDVAMGADPGLARRFPSASGSAAMTIARQAWSSVSCEMIAVFLPNESGASL